MTSLGERAFAVDYSVLLEPEKDLLISLFIDIVEVFDFLSGCRIAVAHFKNRPHPVTVQIKVAQWPHGDINRLQPHLHIVRYNSAYTSVHCQLDAPISQRLGMTKLELHRTVRIIITKGDNPEQILQLFLCDPLKVNA